jgi:hypothetical protein
VAATRKLYPLTGATLTREQPGRPKRFATGTRDNQRGHTLGPITAGGQVKLDVSASELLEYNEIMFGPATVTTPTGSPVTAKLHTYKPGLTLTSATIERNDGARIRRAVGVMGNQWALSGSVDGSNVVTVDLFASDYDIWAGPLTTLADRTPTYMEGWQTNVYADAFAGTAGTTLLATAVTNWDISIGNNLQRKRWAGNTLAIGASPIGELDVKASLTLEAASTAGAAELANWQANTSRLLRFEFLGPANGIETGFAEFVTVDIPGAWSAADLNGTDQGTRMYKLDLDYLYSSTLAAGVVVRCQAGRTAAFA